MADRSVREGRLGCPVCHREYPIVEGVVRFGDPALRAAGDTPGVTADGLAAFLGLSGPGGYLGLVGMSGEAGAGLTGLLPGVHLVLVNPPEGSAELPMMSLLLAEAIPIKSRSLRGVVLGAGFADDPLWRHEAARVVLPGLRVVGQGDPPDEPDLLLLGAAGGWWVAQRQ
jgi:hypothetical protein